MATSPVPAETNATAVTNPLAGGEVSAAPAPVRKMIVVRGDKRTGKLVTATVLLPAATSSLQSTPQSSAKPARIAPKPPAYIARIVSDAASANHVDPLLVHSIIQVESNYNAFAESPKGARGLMQLMPPTAHEMGVSNSFDPKQNIEAGVRYLKQLQDLYRDDRLALAAYNAGPAAVQKYKQQIPPYPETQAYVQRVAAGYVEARKAAGIAPAAAEAPAQGKGPEEALPVANAAPAVPAALTEEAHPKLEQFVDEQGRLHLRTAPR